MKRNNINKKNEQRFKKLLKYVDVMDSATSFFLPFDLFQLLLSVIRDYFGEKIERKEVETLLNFISENKKEVYVLPKLNKSAQMELLKSKGDLFLKILLNFTNRWLIGLKSIKKMHSQ